jgi:hypothetical protein
MISLSIVLPRSQLTYETPKHTPSADKLVLHLLHQDDQEPSEDPTDMQAARKHNEGEQHGEQCGQQSVLTGILQRCIHECLENHDEPCSDGNCTVAFTKIMP